MATAESARSGLLSHLVKSAERFCALTDVKDFCLQAVSKRQVPVALLLHVTRCSIFSNSSIILPRLLASIGVTCSTLAAHSYALLVWSIGPMNKSVVCLHSVACKYL